MPKPHLATPPEPYPRVRSPHYLPETLFNALVEVARVLAAEAPKAFQIARRRVGRTGRTLRPGENTPLWNELRRQLRPHLRRYGTQANLGRLLGLPRQRINGFVTGCGEMPDAERTLQLLAWLMAIRSRKPPS